MAFKKIEKLLKVGKSERKRKFQRKENTLEAGVKMKATAPKEAERRNIKSRKR